MKKIVSLLLTAVLIACCVSLTGCSSGYTSSYNAVGLAQTNTDTNASMSFSEFQGVKVFELKFKDGYSKSLIYNLKLEVGTATIYYDTDGVKKELATVKAGKSVNSKLKDLTCSSMYIIVESSEKILSGNFSFEAKVI